MTSKQVDEPETLCPHHTRQNHAPLNQPREELCRNLKFPISTIILLTGLPILLIFLSFFIGRYSIDPVTIIQMVLSPTGLIAQDWSGTDETVLFQIRLPRILAALMVGAALSMAGASYQGLFKNPLVSPDILGVSAGAGFGAAIAILFSSPGWVIQVSAFIFGGLAVMVTYLLGKLYRQNNTLILVLAGVVVGAFFSALLSLIKYIADPYEKLPTIIFWLMGSLSSTKYSDILAIGPILIGCGTVLLLIRWRINLLSLSEDEATALGLDVKKITRIIILCATLITASAVSISGIIGWVGLVVPHLGRMITGPDYARLLPVTVIIGATFLLVVDDLSRSITTTEIPLGILTAIIGAPFFAWLLSKRSTGWS